MNYNVQLKKKKISGNFNYETPKQYELEFKNEGNVHHRKEPVVSCIEGLTKQVGKVTQFLLK